jgi:tetratricopeptide (TPR) repeat protein
LAVIIAGKVVPESMQRGYWIVQQQLIPHANCCYRWIESGEGEIYCLENSESEGDETSVSSFDAVHMIGYLLEDQGKQDEAEKMYMRALKGMEKALDVDHTSTLITVNNLALLYRRQGKLDEAEEMYMRALEGLRRRCVLITHQLWTQSTIWAYFTEFRLGNVFIYQKTSPVKY